MMKGQRTDKTDHQYSTPNCDTFSPLLLFPRLWYSRANNGRYLQMQNIIIVSSIQATPVADVQAFLFQIT